MANSILAKMSVLISANTAAFNRNLQQSQAQFQKFTGSIQSAASTMGIAFGSAAIFQGLKYGVGVIADFEQRMSEVQAITQSTGRGLEKLRKNALELGRSTKYTAEQVAELQVAYGRLGFTEKEILQVTAATLDLATATGEDLAKSADIAGSTLRGFGLDASEMERVIDVMAASFNKSALGLENFSEAMKYVAPVAAANNISLEETTALLGTLADNGIRGSMAGTSLRKIISDLDRGTKPLNEKLKDLAAKGFDSADAMDEVGRTAYASLLTLVKYTDKTNELGASLGNATGEASNMARVMEDNLIGDWTKLTSAVDGFILKFSDAGDGMRGFTQDLTKLINLLSTNESITALKALGDFVGIIPRALMKYNNLVIGKAIDLFGGDTPGGAGSSWEEVPKKIEEVNKGLTTEIYNLDAIEKKIKELNEAFSATSIKDTGRLRMLAMEQTRLELLAAKIKSIQAMARSSAKMDLNALAPTDSLTKGLGTDMDSVMKRLMDVVNKLPSIANKTKEVKEAFLDMSSGIANAMTSIANDIGAALGGDKTIRFGDSILKAVANFASEIGQALIGIGTAMLAAKMMIKNPVTAIAAGVALVALAGAMNASLSKAQASFNKSGSGGASTYQSASRYSTDLREDRIQFDARFVMEGDDLVAVVNKTSKRNSRLKG